MALRNRIELMKQTTLTKQLLLAFFLLIGAFSSAKAQTISKPAAASQDANKILIVYLPRTNNTKAIAELIHKQVITVQAIPTSSKKISARIIIYSW